MPKYKWVLLDFDGVIVGSERIARQVSIGLLNRVLLSSGVAPLAEASYATSPIATVSFRKKLQMLRAERRIAISDSQLEQLVAEQLALVVQRLGAEVEVTPGFYQALDKIYRRGYQVGIVTTSSWERVEVCCEKIGLDFRRELIFCADSQTPPLSKPDRLVYVRAAEQFGASLYRSVAVEDSVSGVRSAVDAGIICVGYTGASSVPERRILLPALVRAGAIAATNTWGGVLHQLVALEHAT